MITMRWELDYSVCSVDLVRNRLLFGDPDITPTFAVIPESRHEAVCEKYPGVM